MFGSRLFLIAGVTTEVTCRSEFAELVTYHVFGNVHRNKLITIVNSKGMTNEFGSDHGSAAPCFDHRFLPALIHGTHLFVKLHADKGAFF